MQRALRFGLVLHDIETDDLNIVADQCFFLEETLFISNDIPRNHWELAIGNDQKMFLISTCAENGVEVFKAKFQQGHIFYAYEDRFDQKANIIGFMKIEPLKVKDLIQRLIRRSKQHRYKLFYDNCHNNALFGYMQFGVPNERIVNIVNKKYGLKLLY